MFNVTQHAVTTLNKHMKLITQIYSEHTTI